ncbi:BQ5605_C005g03335 [Microbotryum silenes-dioicae]|uniref:Acyl-protein thioesterase 1 n=1 Tax=Microbotryum silenes-dioicae TaxID=796604 RepID=A0A2X0MAD1_9BASI|nr:BQ5605_C005g03335 [Microbotryum silenes-dioicae]
MSVMTVLPKGKHTATIIFSHGLGDSAAGWYPFAQALAPRFKHVKWVLPTAPTQPVTLNGGMPMNSWFDIRSLTPTNSSQEDERGLLASVRTISDWVASEVDAGIPANRIVVGGFSQGAVVSLAVGATLERKLAGLISLSGFLMLADKLKSMQVDHAPSYPVFWGHGTGDPVVRYQWGEMSVQKLRELGWKNIQFESYPGMQHTLGAKEQQDVEAWLKKILPEHVASCPGAKLTSVGHRDPSTISFPPAHPSTTKPAVPIKNRSPASQNRRTRVLEVTVRPRFGSAEPDGAKHAARAEDHYRWELQATWTNDGDLNLVKMTTTTPKKSTPAPRNRLPALAEVLRRNTRPPVDLYCYYLFLQREGSEDTLDFWLDVQQHENLCTVNSAPFGGRAYFKDLRKSGRTVREDWPRYHELARTRGSIYGGVTGIRRGDDGREGGEEVPGNTAPASPRPSVSGRPQAFSGSDYGETRVTNEKADGDRRGPSLGGEREDALRTPSPRPRTPASASYPLSPTLQALYPHDSEDRPRNGRLAAPAQPYIMRDTAISRTDLIASAERIYSRYLMPGADKEVYLPPALRITEFTLSSSNLPTVTHPDYDREADAQAQVPDMFHAQKEYVYRAMEQDTFPRFLRAKAFGNLTPISALVRLAFGLLALWVGLATGFAFIFLDKKPKVSRLWVIIPFTFAIINLVAHAYDLDPLLVFMGLSETEDIAAQTPFRTIGIREPYVRKLLFGRALWVTFLSAVVVAILTIIFVLVPGHRL